MSRPCSVCTRSDAGTIAEMLQAGGSARSVAAAFGLGDDAVLRHARNHLGKPSRSVPGNVPGNVPAPLDELVVALRERALAGSDSASREYRLALAAQSTARHATAPVAVLETSDEWIGLRTAILAALEPFDEARQAVADALEPA